MTPFWNDDIWHFVSRRNGCFISVSDTKHTLKKEQLKNSFLSLACGGGGLWRSTQQSPWQRRSWTETHSYSPLIGMPGDLWRLEIAFAVRNHTHTQKKNTRLLLYHSVLARTHIQTQKIRTLICLRVLPTKVDQCWLPTLVMTFNVSFLCVYTSRSLSLARFVYVIVATAVCFKAPRITGAIISNRIGGKKRGGMRKTNAVLRLQPWVCSLWRLLQVIRPATSLTVWLGGYVLQEGGEDYKQDQSSGRGHFWN